ncbi:hypothetical protein FCL47_14260 [Desulfopila sp. IMCC35006]|uniref:hypothetical protein n=1 Tax=Desulfopila sp. IMCC35006 TaxID=2569542 RepID=UPI0010AB9AE5|nr:hypothetical protein [Desulfopila sp. IMCC35006]TKB25222.1 hypothetical protein FCL47_14260 [Desulfopila sp. IMCC35006]
MENRASADTQSDHQAKPPPADKRHPARHYIFWALGIAALFCIAYGIFYVNITPEKPLDNFFAILEEQGYEPNIGFSGNHAPGNIIQIMEKGGDGEKRQLNPPIVVLWKEQCFPGKSYRESLYMLPESAGKNSAQLNLGAEILGTMMPVLQLDGAVAATYSMKLENTRVLSFAKLDLSQQFSRQCVQALEQDLGLGNEPEWYAVILEAIVVDAISFEIKWQENSTAAARNKVKQAAEKTLAAIVQQERGAARTAQGEVSLASDNQKTTVIKAAGEVIVGYRARQLEAVFGK